MVTVISRRTDYKEGRREGKDGAGVPGLEGGRSSPLALLSALPWHWLGWGQPLQRTWWGQWPGELQPCSAFGPWQGTGGRVPGDGRRAVLHPVGFVCHSKGVRTFLLKTVPSLGSRGIVGGFGFFRTSLLLSFETGMEGEPKQR